MIDIYDHYRWRWRQKHPDPGDPTPGGDGDDVGFGLATDDGWQSKYFDESEAVAERLFWLAGAGG